MPLTYATEDELRERAGSAALDGSKATWLQQCLYAAERAVDNYTRQPPIGTLAFTATASATRYFNDPNTGVIHIDDATAISAVTRAGGALTVSTDYYLYPYNGTTDKAPYTEIHLTGTLGLTPLNIGGTGYGYPYKGVGIRQIAVTGTWGFCTAANIPYDVKEATLTLALWLLRKPGVKATDLAAALLNPNNMEIAFVKGLLEPYRCYGRSLIA